MTSGSGTLKDATNEAIRDWVANVEDTHYIIGSVVGPAPYPAMVRDFQAVIGRETRGQILAKEGRLPDAPRGLRGRREQRHRAVPRVRGRRRRSAWWAWRPAGWASTRGKHGASLARGAAGILHGSYSYVLQDEDGQIQEAHSVAAGLDYPSVGPEHAFLKDSGRVEYTTATDEEALAAFQTLSRLEGIIPALESAHAIAYLLARRPRLRRKRRGGGRPLRTGRQGRVQRRRDAGGEAVSARRESRLTEAFRRAGHPLLIPYAVGGYPDLESCAAILRTYAEAGAGIIEIGVPFSDPLADGPVIQAASQAALRAGTRPADVLDLAGEAAGSGVPVVLLSYLNTILAYGSDALLRATAGARAWPGWWCPTSRWRKPAICSARRGSAGWTWSCSPPPRARTRGSPGSPRRRRGSSTACRPPG